VLGLEYNLIAVLASVALLIIRFECHY